MIVIDCRGLEFIEFKPEVRYLSLSHTATENGTENCQGEFKAVGAETGTKFSGIDLSEGEWYEYDEKASEEVSITNVKWEIRRA